MWQSILEKLIIAVISTVISSLIAFIGNRLSNKKLEIAKIRERQQANENGTCALLRADIIRSYEKYVQRGEIPLYAREAVEKQYTAYHALGGNGSITHLWDEIQELPIKT